MNRAILQGMGTAGGTIVGLGAGTILLSQTCIIVGRTISRQRRLKHAVDCSQCDGRGLVKCSVCRGDKVVEWSPFKEKPEVPRPCMCPTCSGTTNSKCLNCLGKGIVY